MSWSIWIAIACALCGTGVGAGAFGAHGLSKILSPDKLVIFETAVRYQMFHGLALLGLGVVATRIEYWQLLAGGLCFVFGSLLFSGSLYAYVATDNKTLVFLTPIGGSILILGWIFFAWSVLRAF